VDQRKVTLTLASLFIAGSAFISASVAQAEPAETSGKVLQSGHASWYGPGFHGRKTASGETFNTNDLTAAHRTLPFGTKVKVVNKKTGKSVVVRINDRGPYAHGRVIDLSKASAQALGISGVGSVTLAQL
jgi:rare lipoprotein A